MKIIEAISDTNIGGAGVLLINRLSNTDLNKYPTLVVVPRGSALCQRLEAIGVDYVEADCDGDISFDLKAIKIYKRIFKENTPDIINCHGCLSARIAAKMCRVPIKICTRHCVFPVKKRDRAWGFFNNYISDSFIAVAYAAKGNLLELGIDEEKINVIINGSRALRKIDADEKKRLKQDLNIDESTTVIGLSARLEKCKGHEWFLQSVKILSKHGMNFKVLLLGDGTQRQRIEELCCELGINERVIFCGFVEDVSPFMNIVDININCSIGTETSSLALSEGMSLGIPAVVSDYGGNPYMIKHGENGFVCKCFDSSEMAEYIERLANDRDLYAQMSKKAYQRFCTELNAEAMTKKTNQLYDKLWRAYRRAEN